MKIVISGYYGFNNSGDDALLLSMIDDLKTVVDKGNITVLSKKPQETERVYGVRAVSRYNIFLLLKNIFNCDLLISGGGTLIQDATSTKSLLYYLMIIRIAQMFGKKVMLYASGIGPLHLQKNVDKTKKILNKVGLITLRDEKSKEVLEKIGVDKPVIRVTADPAFSLAANSSGRETLDNYGVPKDRPILGISVREWKNNPENFVDIIAEFCDYAAKKYGFYSVFIPMQKRLDYELAVKIKNKMQSESAVMRAEYPVGTLLSIMQEVDICVGMRLHTLIYSANCIIPMMGIVYDPKIIGFMESMGENHLVKVEDVSPDSLHAMLDDVCRNYDTIRARLSVKVRKLKAGAKENIEYVKKYMTEEPFDGEQ
ncbi:MAG: polysaccharide pyruvyl transferase CsaB [Firmicutes bacterium]|nr:polysaccharide pyruvyl transferase CsaB [Bacillota bacterium]